MERKHEPPMPLYKDGLIIPCEICGQATPMEELCSFIYTYAMPGPGKSGYQPTCQQHYACSHEHAILALLRCVLSHNEEKSHLFVKKQTTDHQPFISPLLNQLILDLDTLMEDQHS